MDEQRICRNPTCKKPFEPTRHLQFYCCYKCRDDNYKIKRKFQNSKADRERKIRFQNTFGSITRKDVRSIEEVRKM